MGKRRAQLAFVRDFLVERGGVAFHGHVLRDPLCLTNLEPGRVDPYPIYRRIRARGKFVRSSLGPYATATHEVCHRLLRDRRFGAASDDPRLGAPDLSFLTMNPPDHDRLRRFALPTFSPRAVAGFAPFVRATTDRLLDRVSPGEPFDLVSTLAAPLPIAVITELLGVPDANAEEFADYGATFGSALGGLQSLRHARELMRAQDQLTVLFTELLEVKRRDPGSDVLSRLAAADPDTVRPEEAAPMCILLLIAGFETTVNLIGNTMLALLERPRHLAARLRGPAPCGSGRRGDSPVRCAGAADRSIRSRRGDGGRTHPLGGRGRGAHDRRGQPRPGRLRASGRVRSRSDGT